MTDIKYTPEDIDRIYKERVYSSGHLAGIKKGVIVEWLFMYPNGRDIAFVEASYPINEDNFSFEIGCEVCTRKIKNKLWEICGQYSIVTGEKL